MGEINLDIVINDIFDSSESNNWIPSDKIPLVTRDIEKLKLGLRVFLEESDYDILSIAKEAEDLCRESKELIEEMEACQQEVEQKTMAEILKTIESRDTLSTELQLVNFTAAILSNITACAKHVNEFEECKKNQNFTQAVENIAYIVEILECPAEGFASLSMYENIKSTSMQIWESLRLDLGNQWDQMVAWTIKATGNKEIIEIVLKIEDDLTTADVLSALNIGKELPEKLAIFSNFLLTKVFIPIIRHECKISTPTEDSFTLTVNNVSQKSAFKTVLANIKHVFDFLNPKLDFVLNTDESILEMIGKEISIEFSDILIKECLVETIPNSINELQSYGKITSTIEEFQQFLIALRFFPKENFSILQYVNNIDVLFAEKCSQYFLDTARQIMLKDLSSTMSIGVETIPDSNVPNALLVDSSDEEALKIFDGTIPQSLFYFPRCMISKTAQELLDLIYMMMEQAVQCSDIVCKKLYMTTKLVFELYDAVVPYHHENFLQTIPQYVALYHNNCMYLAHNMLTFGDKWLTLMEGRSVQYPIGFQELAPRLRARAQTQLAQHLQTQRAQIHHYIRSSDLNCIVVKDVLSENAEQAIRQCLRQLQLLKNVWIGVFPANVFTRLMATLVNMFVDEIIHRVCTVEDISAEMATQLTEIYTIVVKKAPNVFQKPSDIEECVKSWVKLQELILVLSGSLKDIEKRWSDGAGPLAAHFRTKELRSLIKALFQNTQFRANLLCKIK